MNQETTKQMSPNALQLLQVLTLCSSNLPIGAYCYSQGIESAIEQEVISDEASCHVYLTDMLELLIGRYELPMLGLLLDALQENDVEKYKGLAHEYRASRETGELHLESMQLAHAFNAWITNVLGGDIFSNNSIQAQSAYGFLPAFACVANALGIPKTDALMAYGFSQIENAVLVVVKTVPLGQMAGQRVLWQLHKPLSDVVQNVLNGNVSLSANLPGLAMLSSQHETQHCRLFRS